MMQPGSDLDPQTLWRQSKLHFRNASLSVSPIIFEPVRECSSYLPRCGDNHLRECSSML